MGTMAEYEIQKPTRNSLDLFWYWCVWEMNCYAQVSPRNGRQLNISESQYVCRRRSKVRTNKFKS